LSGVRLHTDREAAEATLVSNATALTAGPHILFGPGMFAPGTTDGYRRLAHELAHFLQQSRGSASRPPASAAFLELEARQAAEKAGHDPGATVHVPGRPEARGHVQRDGPLLDPPALARPWTPPSQHQLQLSPEMRRLMWEMEFERWMTARQATLPVQPLDQQQSPPADAAPDRTTIPSPREAAEAAAGDRPLVPRGPEMPGAAGHSRAGQPDMGAILEPFLTRAVPLYARDADAATQLYWRNYEWVRLLPEPPAPFRSWIPADWRRSVAQSLTTSAIQNSALRLDFPTPVETFDRQLLQMTGDPKAVPTYINFPAFRF
jgi:hypothetical protein